MLVEEKNKEEGETAHLVLLQLSEFSFRSKALGRCKMVFSILQKKKCSLSTLLSSSELPSTSLSNILFDLDPMAGITISK